MFEFLGYSMGSEAKQGQVTAYTCVQSFGMEGDATSGGGKDWWVEGKMSWGWAFISIKLHLRNCPNTQIKTIQLGEAI